jgi:hypothetical protein
MSIISREGLNTLKFAYLIFVVGLGVAVFLVGGSYLYWQSEKKNNVLSQRTLSDMQARLSNAKRERDDLRNSEDTYKTLTARGVFVAERRLDLLDAMEALKKRHQLITLEYEMTTQRPLTLAAGTSLSAVDALGSRIKLKAGAMHDGDLIAFLDEFPRMQRGLFPIDRCVIKRKTDGDAADVAPAERGLIAQTLSAINNISRRNNALETVGGNSTSDDAAESPRRKAAIEAECTLEWITLLDKRSPQTKVADASGARPLAGGRPQ